MWNAFINRLSHWEGCEHIYSTQGGGESAPKLLSAAVGARERSVNNLSIISDATSDPREEDWPTDNNFKLNSDFSDLVYEYQSKEIGKATGDTSDDSDSRAHTTQWLRELPESFTPAATIRDTMKEWPKSNRAQSERGTECSKAQDETAVLDTGRILSIDSTEAMKQMSFLGGMEYARHRLQEATASRSSGKGHQIRPPAVPAPLAQTTATGPHGESRSTSPESRANRATSGRSSAYRAVHEAAMARKTLLEAQTGARQATMKLAGSKAECSREHHTITIEIEAVQEELRKTTELNIQNQEMQVENGRHGIQNCGNHGFAS